MYASTGGALAATGILLTVVLALIFRHPRAPGWMQGELVAELAAVAATAIVGLGLGYLLVAVVSFESERVGWTDLAGLGAAVSVVVVAWWLLDPRGRLKAYDRAAVSGSSATGVLDLDPTPPAPAPRPGPVSRRAA